MATIVRKTESRGSGIWFPLCLAFLLLLTVPGLVLLAMHLLGMEGSANGWMRDHWNLTYHISLPWWGAVLLLLSPFVIVLLYFLKMKRKPLQVPSTFLWRKSIEDLQVNSLFQWLRDNVLLLLQLLIVLLLIYAAMSFQFHGKTTVGAYYIVMIDNSASMSATDVLPNRLEVAKQQALEEIARHDNNDYGMVIAFNSRATLLQPYTNDLGMLRSAVQRISPTQRPTRIEEALSLADSLANPHGSADRQAVRPVGEDPSKAREYVGIEGIAAEVHLFSDGGFSDGGNFAAGKLELRYHRIGKEGVADNVGIVDFNAVRDPLDPSQVKLFCRVQNFRTEAVFSRLEVKWRRWGEQAFKLKELPLSLRARTIVPGDPDKNEPGTDTPGEEVVTVEIPDLEEGTLATVQVSLVNNKDAFPLDDQAWLVLGVVRKARVLIVTAGNEILHNFFDLEATAKVANVKYLKPEELKDEAKYGRPAGDGAFDLVIFDSCAPASVEALPRGNTFFINSVPPPWLRKDMKPLAGVQIRNASSKHPLMANLTALDEIAFTDAFRFELDARKDERLPQKIPRLLETDKETAVLFALGRGDFTDLVLTFPLVNARGEWTTTWNLKLSFPVFLRNVLFQLGHVSDASAEENLQPGEVKTLRPETAVREVFVTGPGDRAAEVVQRNSQSLFTFNNTERVGLYGVKWQGGELAFSVNLLDGEESNLLPRDVIHVANQTLQAGPTRGQPRDTWKWWTLAAFALLGVEWFFYHRRYYS